MLKILCCVKQVPDVDQMRMDPETGNLIRAGVPAILNPQDANALSAAMSVKETYGGEVTLITMGPPNAEAALRECLAVGADKAVLVTDRAFGNADTLATSYSILSAASTQDKYDMIFCGKESLDGATGQMGAQLAQRFGAAQVTGALLIKEVNEEAKTAVVERELEDGVETLEVVAGRYQRNVRIRRVPIAEHSALKSPVGAQNVGDKRAICRHIPSVAHVVA